jgi:hypothetical protein
MGTAQPDNDFSCKYLLVENPKHCYCESEWTLFPKLLHARDGFDAVGPEEKIEGRKEKSRQPIGISENAEENGRSLGRAVETGAGWTEVGPVFFRKRAKFARI